MKTLNLAGSYILMALVTFGMVNVPHAIFYEHPSLLWSRYFRDELKS